MKEYKNRVITECINEANKYFPVITITGPRQSGKTTLIKHLFDDLPYYSLENLDTRNLANNDPVMFLNENERGMILDEVQNAPHLLSYIQGIVDDFPEKRFVLSGSSNFAMLHSVTQSLAGRSAVFELMPLSLTELTDTEKNAPVDELLFKGMYPAVWVNNVPPSLLYGNYVKTYIERDVRQLLAVKDLDLFQKFLRLCAVRIGSIFNASELANEIGVAVNTINSWLSILKASYIVVMLQPFYTNTRKRLTKSPKLYFTDTGLAAYLLEIESREQMSRDKMRGHLFENFIVTEFFKHRYNQGKDNNLCFYRDSNQNEVDLVVRNRDRLKLIEIKSSATYHSEFEKGIKAFEKTFGDMVEDRVVIYTGSLESEKSPVKLLNYKRLDGIM